MSDTMKSLLAMIEAGDRIGVKAFLREMASASSDKGELFMSYDMEKAFDGDLNAALSLFDALLPRWKWGRQWTGLMWVEPDDMPGRSERYYGKHDAPATALLLATLHAHKAQLCHAPNRKEAKP